MIKPNYKGIRDLMIAAGILVLVMMFVINSGCVTGAKNFVSRVIETPTPTPTPEPTPIPTVRTPVPTPSAIPTLAAHYVDPFIQGERWEDQWFKWDRTDVQGKKDLMVGIVAYRHAFMDYYTWWNAALGNYQDQKPTQGNRYFVVWVHEEMLGPDTSYDPSMWIFDEDSFKLQVRDKVISPDKSHNPVNRIREFDRSYDFYDTVIAGPFGWQVRYSGYNPETAGYVAEEQGWLRWGPGNAVDGYILFEIPADSKEDEIALLGGFSRFGSAYWKFAK